MAQRALVEQTWPAAADIEQHQPQRAANGRIRAVARPKYVAAGAHAYRVPDRPVHHQEWCGHMRCGLYSIQVEWRFAKREHRRLDYRRVLGPATRHDHVDRQHFTREAAPTRRHAAYHAPGLAA